LDASAAYPCWPNARIPRKITVYDEPVPEVFRQPLKDASRKSLVLDTDLLLDLAGRIFQS
jgi:hypothetical protein